MRTLNLGIVAHVDAGKTSLTERLLYAAGVIGELGNVDDGSTQTDTLALERQRGITIRSAVVSFAIDDVSVNLIDTPGHPDFIAEVERVLHVLDGAVLVVSAVEGVQAQTRILMRALARLRVPVLIFVNKIDRAGADSERVLQDLTERLTPAVISMGAVHGPGTADASFTLYGADNAEFAVALADLLTRHDDDLLAAYVTGEAGLSYRRLQAELAAQARQALVHPVFFGSAITGAGVDRLRAALTDLLPAARGDADGPACGTIFKVERGPAGEKIAYARLFRGTLRVRERLEVSRDQLGNGRGNGRRRPGDGTLVRDARDHDGRGRGERVTAISVFERGPAVPRGSVIAGQIALLRGLADVRIGDTFGQVRAAPAARQFAPPTLETVVVPCRPGDRGRLHLALVQLAEQDPLIGLRQDDVRQELLVSLYGEVQKEVIQATLASDFGVEVGFRETTTLCIERPVGTGAAVERIDTAPNPFRATVGLRIDPAPAGSGVRFRLEIELGALPPAFIKAVDDAVTQTLGQGLRGWQVTDCTVTLTHSGYIPPPPAGWSKWSSSAGDFRHLTPLVVMSALTRAGTAVFEPVHRFRIEMPADTLGPVLPALRRLRAVGCAPATRGALCLLNGEIPAAGVHQLRQQLPALTRGEGVLESDFGRYQPVRGPIPVRPRSDSNPLDRKEYLPRVQRGVAGG